MIRSAVLIQYTRVTDGQTDRQTELVWHIRTIAYMLSRVKTGHVTKNLQEIENKSATSTTNLRQIYIQLIEQVESD